MRIERVDDKTVKCFLSNEELEEYDIDYKDFIFRSEKAREVMQEIIEQAAEEVDYKPPKLAFDLQIMMLPDQGMILTFSEKEPADLKENEQLFEYLRDMKQILQRAREKTGAASGGSAAQQGMETAQKPEASNPEGKEAARPEEAVFVFDRLSSVMEYAAAMPSTLRVSSALYCMDGAFYLYLQKGAASYERYSRACIQAMEFGSLYTADADRMLYLQEHGECLIAEQALKKLRAVNG